MKEHDKYRILGKLYDPMFGPGFSLTGVRQEAVDMYEPESDMRVLDVGFGTGTQLKIYQQLGCEIHGIDRSPTMVEVAQKKLGAGVDLRQEDATAMSFDNHTFDLVTAMFMLHEVPEDVRWQIVDECARVVKMDGRLLFVEFHGGPYSFPKGWLIKAYILFGEMLAGHFEHYRQHIAGGGLPGLLDDLSMQVYGESVSENGNTAMVLLGIAS